MRSYLLYPKFFGPFPFMFSEIIQTTAEETDLSMMMCPMAMCKPIYEAAMI
jgi:hypothetical protein